MTDKKNWKKWTDDDREYLKAKYADTPNSELSKALGRSPNTISKYACLIGLSKSPELIRLIQSKAKDAYMENVKARHEIELKFHVSTNERCPEKTKEQQAEKLKNLHLVYDLIGQGYQTEPAIRDQLCHLSKSSIHEYVHILLEVEKVIVQADIVSKYKHYRQVEKVKPDQTGLSTELKLLMGINPYEVLHGIPIPIDYHSQPGLSCNRGFSYGVSNMEAAA